MLTLANQYISQVQQRLKGMSLIWSNWNFDIMMRLDEKSRVLKLGYFVWATWISVPNFIARYFSLEPK